MNVIVAEEFARARHDGQKYGTRPYADHLREVVEILEVVDGLDGEELEEHRVLGQFAHHLRCGGLRVGGTVADDDGEDRSVCDRRHRLQRVPHVVGVEADLQRLSAERIEVYGEGFSLIRREYMTAIGPVDILAQHHEGGTVAIELKRRGDIDGVEQLTRYLELLNRDPLLAPVRGIFAAQEIKPQARTLAEDRGITCVVLDYDEMRGLDSGAPRLF